MEKVAFQVRSFTSMLTAFSFAVMGISGLLLFIVPQGRIAEWTDWRLLGLAKADWGNIHITTSLLFLVAGILHTWYNWEALVKYLSHGKRKGFAARRETLLPIVITLFFIVGAVYKIPPLNSVLTLNSHIKNSWIINKDYEPPIGHAELLTMKSFTKKLNIDLNRATEALNQRGITFKETESLALIAKNHGTSPVQLYSLIKPFEGAVGPTAAKPGQELKLPDSTAPPSPGKKAEPPPRAAAAERSIKVYTEALVEERFEGRGMGKKTLAAFCEENGVDPAVAKKKLATRQMVLKDGETLKEAAERSTTAPIEILKIFMVGEPVK